jgi:polysaccharide export outer membrane protein
MKMDCESTPDAMRAKPTYWPVVWFCLLAAFLSCVAGSGCKSAPENGAHARAFATFDGTGYPTNRLKEGDVVSIAFQYSTNFNATQKIALDGTMNLEGAGMVRAAGLTSIELQKELEKLYKSQTKDDPITIKVVMNVAAVYVSGAVLHPGKISMERPLTVVEAVMEAGGLDPYRAKASGVSVLRIENGRQVSYRLDLNKMIEGKSDVPFYLQPYDVVQVPTKTFNF